MDRREHVRPEQQRRLWKPALQTATKILAVLETATQTYDDTMEFRGYDDRSIHFTKPT